jgi:subtilase family serine protease
VKNQGTAAGAFRLGFYFYSAGTGAVFSGSSCDVSGGLAAGATSNCSTSVTIPVSLPSGSYYLVALADDQTQVSESNENNNYLIATTGVVTVSAGPDLIATALTAPTAGTAGGSLAAVSVTSKNQGAGAAGGFRVGFYFYSSGSGAVFSGTSCSMAGGLAVNATSTCNTSVAIPVSLTPGTYYFIAVADDQSQVNESSETNNWFLATTGAVMVQ